MKENWKIALLLSICVFLLNLSLIFDVGFISDDWDLLLRSGSNSIFSAVEEHHYSPFITAIFSVVGYFDMSPTWIHVLAFLIHGFNIYLVLTLCGRMGMSQWEKWIAATLFALSPAGYESLAWCCAIGYILCTTWILLSIRLLILSKGEINRSVALRLVGLQLIAFVTWDWGILLAPSLYIVNAIYHKNWNIKGLLPVFFTWAAVLIGKKVAGFSFGYEPNSFKTALSHLGTSFMLSLWPEFSRSFYFSFSGIALAAFSFLFFFWMAYKDKISRLGLCLFCFSVLPVLTIGYPQSRYVYLSAIFLYWILARLFDKNRISRSVAIIYVIASLFWTVDRRDLWLETDQQARHYKKSVEVALGNYEKIALKNVPHQVKGYDRIWLPSLWRCGVQCFGSNVLIMNPFGQNELSESDVPENYRVLQIGDRRKMASTQ